MLLKIKRHFKQIGILF